MQKVFEFCVDRKRSVICLMILIFLMGVFSYNNIPRESNPDVKIPLIYVVVTQRGISPEDAKKMIVQPLEIGLQGLENVKKITSYASEGAGSISIEFFAGADADQSLNDVRNKVNDIKHNLPKDSDEPIIKQIDLSLMPILNVALTGNLPLREMLQIARDIKNQIEKISSVREVNIAGETDEAVQIIVKPEMMERYKLSTSNLQQIIVANNVLVTAGTVQKPDGSYSIKIPGLVSDYASLMNFPIYSKNGEVLKVGDVAEVTRDFKDITNITRVNGEPAVVLEVSKISGANIIKTVSEIKNAVESERGRWPEGITILYGNDESTHIRDMIEELENGILLAALLVLIIIVMAVGMRSALLIALSLPVSFFACILVLEMCGYTLNIVVLFSLILTVGMIVDDAIVVTEYADRKLMEDHGAEKSYLEAATRMFVPIFTATLVKIVVFLPFLFWPGILGQFMKYLPITVMIIMTNSIIFALLIQPAIGAIWMKNYKKPSEEEAKAITAAETGDLSDIKGFTGKYVMLLEKAMLHPKRVVGGIVCVMISTITIFAIKGPGVEFFPNVEPDHATVVVRSAGNLSPLQKSEMMKKVEKQLFEFKDDIKIFYTKIGDLGGGNDFPDDTIGIVNLEFTDWQNRPKSSAIVDIIEKNVSIPGAIVQMQKERKGPVSGKPIQMNVNSRNHEKAMKYTEKLIAAMNSTLPGFKNIDSSLPVPAIEWDLQIDKEMAAKYLVSTTDIGNIVQMATSGLKISSCRLDDLDYEVDILVRFPEANRITSRLPNIRIINPNGDIIPINKFVTQEARPLLSQIKRINREDVVTVTADVQDGYLVDSQVKALQKWLKENTDNNITVVFQGDTEDQEETSTFLSNAFLLVLATTFLIMLTQFNNFYDTFVVMTAIFLSVTGVLLGLLATGQPFGIVMCGIGIIALAGIVLNNTILMVDTFHYLQKMGYSSRNAIIRACAQRIRPILLTASAAVLGLLPLATRITFDFFTRHVTYDAPSTQWWTQLATSIVGGLTFGTILTLFFTPCLLAIKYLKK